MSLFFSSPSFPKGKSYPADDLSTFISPSSLKSGVTSRGLNSASIYRRGNSSTPSVYPSETTEKSIGLNPGVIGGAVLLVLAILLIIAVIWARFRWRARTREAVDDNDKDLEDQDADTTPKTEYRGRNWEEPVRQVRLPAPHLAFESRSNWERPMAQLSFPEHTKRTERAARRHQVDRAEAWVTTGTTCPCTSGVNEMRYVRQAFQEPARVYRGPVYY